MCELMGMSANVPTDICFSFTGFISRGGERGPHKDGWGIAFYEADGYREFRDPHPSAHSPIAKLIQSYPIKSNIVISHIRQANVGSVKLANTHPFFREMWGKPWCYAHNGQLANWQQLPLNNFRPMGDTDSEHAFCWLLGQLQNDEHLWRSDQPAFLQKLHRLCEQLRALGVFNMLLSDGEYLYTYCSTKLGHITRRAPFGLAQLKDKELSIDFTQHTTEADVVSVIATEPLTDNEVWQAMQCGELLVWRAGLIVEQLLSAQSSTQSSEQITSAHCGV